MLKNILQLKAPTLATKGNLNNHLGECGFAVTACNCNHFWLDIVQVPSGNFAERILRVFHYQSGQT
jgi:hypothetical protein